jgi:hypothetical protein
MKAKFLHFAVVVAFLFTAQIVNAQAVITEYFDIKEGVTADFSDKKTVQTIYTKGVVDIEWNGKKRILAISYDPKQTKIADIMLNVQNLTGENAGICINNKALQQYSRIR